ncbi:MAG: hypothetical protein JRI23_22150 [Deltaproteobacteria bacterium]|jgi:hypothetical protein|nr:hypothetical protein [Deltaproteobacteria bacterium]MBW2534662.1 hypothetical protein [Deltaproteobacteria bacterium]
MAGAAWSAVCVTLVALASGLAWAYPFRIRRLVRLDDQALVELARLDEEQRPERLLRLAGREGWARELAQELRDCRSDAERVAAINVALDAVEHELSERRSWPIVAVWLAASATLLCLVAGFVSGARSELLAMVPIGLAGPAVCFAARRAGARQAERQRARVDRIAEVVAGTLYERHVDMPTTRRRRRSTKFP